MSEERFDRIEQRLDRLETGQVELKADVDRHFDAIDQRFDELREHMGTLHEVLIARIAALPERSGPTQAEFAEERSTVDGRLQVLEAVARQHSADIDGLKRRSN